MIKLNLLSLFACLLAFISVGHALDLVSQDELNRSYQLSERWFVDALEENGRFRYIYDPHVDAYPGQNNEIRQLMASRLLAELASKDESLKDEHKRNLQYVISNWVKKKQDLSFIIFEKRSKLGANAMLLRTLVASPFYAEYKDLAVSVKNAVLYSINSDGSMNPYLVEPGTKYDWHYLLTFYTGEALVALMEYYQKERGPELLDKIKKSQDFYIDRYVKKLSDNYYPAYVPWHTISLNMLYKETKDQKYADAIFVLNDKLLEIQDRSEHVGRFFNPRTPQYGTPHASSDGVYTEGLAYAYEVASMLKDKHRIAIYGEALEIAFMHLISLQYKAENSSHLPAPKKAEGAFRIRRTSPDAPFSERDGSNVRIDSVQHTLDAFRKYMSLKLSS